MHSVWMERKVDKSMADACTGAQSAKLYTGGMCVLKCAVFVNYNETRRVPII